ncbi:putative phosphoglycerate mutase GpmB [Flexivirga endophytica]|uniref:Phosphoglycerate mutase GpmB n=1 Tax=Flexivirga endophytica TaxID=1849103 RepID=A0A916T0V3_9MICO|nr:histidine phosphatase family protein [Flexivirga endophytica]GGB23570.1 putative phosphoglycerate mutase GpmB [Flexivirga endophytica]GHB57494.1 putative phosphoglycerate mutase GpmB [Flexivirga endophytica]
MTAPLYLVRHGQSEWNVRRLTQGQTPHPRLTELGRQQATRAAALITADLAASGEVVGRIVTSDLTRAVETAEIIAASAGAPIVHDARLREQHLGDLQGRPYDETWSAADAHDWSDPMLPIAGGESPADVHARMAAAMGDIDRTAVVVVVSHGDAIRAALAHFAGHGPLEAPWVAVANGAVARIDREITWLGSDTSQRCS